MPKYYYGKMTRTVKFTCVFFKTNDSETPFRVDILGHIDKRQALTVLRSQYETETRLVTQIVDIDHYEKTYQMDHMTFVLLAEAGLTYEEWRDLLQSRNNDKKEEKS